MSSKMLERETIPGDVAPELIETLPEEAAEVLHYHELKHRKDRLRLRNVLADLKMRPFSAKSVAKYEKKELAKRRATFWARHPDLMENTGLIASSASMLSLVAGLVLVLVVGVSWLAGENVGQYLRGICKAYTIIYAVGTSFLAYFLMLLHARKNAKSQGCWSMEEISTYGKPVPSYALETAIKVKKALPEAVISVKTLVQEDYDFDPFLVVSLEHTKETYHLEVWNEPAFDKQREI